MKRFTLYSGAVLALVLSVSFAIHFRLPGTLTSNHVTVMTLLAMAVCTPILLARRRPPPDDPSDSNQP